MTENTGENLERLLDLIGRGKSFVITTHDTADADGIGAELVTARIARGRGKPAAIVNSSRTPEAFTFMDAGGEIETWDEARHGGLTGFTLIIVDTSDADHVGKTAALIARADEVFVIDHHEPRSGAGFSGIREAGAASTCELVAELAEAADIILDTGTARAAYVGIAYDTGFFAYPKVGERTFRAALALVRLGADPHLAHRMLRENAAMRALHLSRRATAGLRLLAGDRLAVQVLTKEDFLQTGATSEDTDGIVNMPLAYGGVQVSLFVKESPEGKVSGSLRSKGDIDVAAIAAELGGGGHVNAAGFRSKGGLAETVELAIAKVLAG
ncbi:MAG: bifunctional oligoribonuclease/PAP phosphatase NrnA [Treponema sp.]|nr:bifunctional oligoribonuclease/PAP phosphatase NrnA [Treponema sp.]